MHGQGLPSVSDCLTVKPLRSSQEISSLSRSLVGSSVHLLSLSSCGVRVHLLLEESPGLVSLLLKVLEVGNQLDGVNDSVVVEEHASDLASGVTVLLLDVSVDAVTDFLATLSVLHGLKAHNVNGLSLSHLLLHGHLIWVISKLLSVVSWHTVNGGSLLLLVAITASLTVVLAATVVELATLTVVTVLEAGAVVVEVATLTVATLRTTTELTAVLHVVSGEDRLSKETLHEVLLDLLEATLLALLVQLLSGHPELNGEGAGTEGCGLVEALDSTLGAVDVFIKHEVLSVGSLRVEVLALAQFN